MSKTVRLDPESDASAALRWAQSLVGCVVADRYRVEAVITASEIGAVYRAQHVHLKTRVALKVLDVGAAPRDISRFEKEAVAGAHIKHPNVAGATDCGDLPDGAHYLAIEHVPGATLRDVLAKGPMPLPRALRVVRQIALALGATHAQSIVHRNVEPRNIMLTGESGDEVKLIDFGRAKVDVRTIGRESMASDDIDDLTQRTNVLTSMGIIEGTTAYLPPEAALGSAVIDARGDLYSLGVVFYEMLAGKRPFDADDAAPLFKAQREEDVPAIRDRAGVDVPDDIEQIVVRLLERQRDRRFENAEEVVTALDAVTSVDATGSSPGSGRTPLTFVQRVMALPPTLRSSVLIAAVLLPLAIVIGLVATSGPTQRRATTDAEDDAPPRRKTAAASTSAPIVEPAGSVFDVDATASAASVDNEPPDAETLRNTLTQAAKDEHWAKAAHALLALAEIEPEAFKEPGVSAAAVSTAVALETVGGKASETVFEVFKTKLGPRGLWLLFDIVRTKGGTKGSERAARILADPAVSERSPPALKIAFDLVQAPCSQKPALFPRAVQDGDHRAYTALKLLKEMECSRRNSGPCCFRDNKELDAAIEALGVKLKQVPLPR